MTLATVPTPMNLFENHSRDLHVFVVFNWSMNSRAMNESAGSVPILLELFNLFNLFNSFKFWPV